jgi:hypothetical protein
VSEFLGSDFGWCLGEFICEGFRDLFSDCLEGFFFCFFEFLDLFFEGVSFLFETG